MVPGLTPGGHQPGRIGSLNLSFQAFASSGAWWLWREETSRGLSSWLSVAQWISSKLLGVITSHLTCLVPPPFLSMEPPGQATYCQLSVLTAESLSWSWAMCHWNRNNKEQIPKHKDTRCTLWVIHHRLYMFILYCTVTGCGKGMQSSYNRYAACEGLTTYFVGWFCCSVQLNEQRASMERVTRALNKSAIKQPLVLQKQQTQASSLAAEFPGPLLMKERIPITSKLLPPYS